MAEIFLAKQHGSEGFEKLVILKRILTAFFADEQFRNMLIDEAHISMGLSHNNIAQIFDVGKASGRFFLVLELVDGFDLGRLLQRAEKAGAPLPPGLGVYILSEVCRALSYAHAKTDINGQPLGIVHRDVSPHNILISEQGEVKIIDFGVAKAMTKRDRTGAGIVKGKLAFMSPEQALGQVIDHRADLYAVGILLYLLCTGKRPYDGPTDMEVLVRVQSGQFVPPEERQVPLSQSLIYVINKAMHQDREQRYQSADELLVDLEAILRTEFGSAGQTALKLWLAQLSRRDGELPISRNNTTRFSRPGSESVEGRSIELGDDEEEGEIELGRLEATGGRLTDPTVRNMVVRRGTPSPRVTGTESTSLSDLAMPLPDEGPRHQRTSRALTPGHSASDMALSVAEEEPPVRMGGRSRGRGFFKAVLMLAALGGAGAMIWKVLNRPPAEPAAEVEAPATPAPTAATPPPTPAPAVAPAPGTPAPAAAAATPPAEEKKAVAEEKDDKKPADKPRPAAERRPEKPVHEKAHAPDPYARARSWQKPEEPISPGIEHTKPAEEQPAPPQ